ncbi:MAG: response regulator [Rhodanobacter sp.]|jgi:PAS domain S-box-containing protein
MQPVSWLGIGSPGLFHDPIEVVARAGELEAELGHYVEPGFDVFIAKAQHQPDAHEWSYLAKDGNRIPVLLNISTLRRDDGELQGYLGIAVNLTERKRREAALEINERKLRGLFELSPLGIALTNERGQLVEFNESFRALTGYSKQELHALDYWTLTPPEYMEEERNLLQTIEETGRYGPYDKHYVQKGGRHVPIRLNGVSLLIGNEPHVWSIVEDTTTQREAEEAMIDAVAAAEAASKAKSEFLANMSHEIRTPMNAILGMLQLLQRTGLDTKQRDYASKTETAATTLLAILNDILDFSKIEAGWQTLEPHDFELDRLLRDIGVILSANVGDKDVEVVFDVDKSIPKWLVGDALRLQQVLINLAGNAVKFTHFGEVVLAVRAVEQSMDHITLTFEIRDTGIGIAGDKLTSIFEGFSQAEASTTRRFGGSGLGLAISQRLVTLMGGTLQVESELGHGSRFFFTIELELAITRPVVALPANVQLMHGLRTLVVDDNDSAREMVGEIVSSLDWTCDNASSGEQALEKIIAASAKGQPYDAIFMDWSMPGMDGWQTSQRIRELSDSARMPLIVMVTMHDREKVAERAAHEPACVDGFLIKPVTGSMVLDAVADARAGRGAEVHTGAPARSPSHHLGCLNGMLLLVVEDNQINQQVARELLEDEGARVEVAGGGDAIRRLVENGGAYDAILMDIQMPDMDGYTATRRIRASLGFRSLPIIAMTANVLASDREACLSAGMNDHIGKPFDLDLVVERLLYWTGRSRAAAAAVRDASATTPAQTITSTLDWQAALARFGGKQRAYLAALDRFPESAAELMQGISAAVTADHRDKVAALAHTLKGIAGTVGANQVAELVASLEQQLRGTGEARLEQLPLDELRSRIDQTVRAVRAIPIRLAATPAPDPAVIPLDRTRLQKLATLLQASNLRSIEWFESMRESFVAFPEAHHRIEEALARLDMPMALIVCQQLLRAQQGDSPAMTISDHGDDASRWKLARSTSPRAQVLIVDDQPINIRLLYQVFAEEHDVFMASSGEQALAHCRSNPPDLILLDVVMHGMSGLEVCRTLKDNPETAMIPVIFVTSRDTAEEEEACWNAGCVDFITKPINAQTTRNRVRGAPHAEAAIRRAAPAGLDRWTHRYRQQAPVRRATATGVAPLPTLATAVVTGRRRYRSLQGLQRYLRSPGGRRLPAQRGQGDRWLHVAPGRFRRTHGWRGVCLCVALGKPTGRTGDRRADRPECAPAAHSACGQCAGSHHGLDRGCHHGARQRREPRAALCTGRPGAVSSQARRSRPRDG